jgi:multidrug efflux system membrane fusion protein
MTQISRYMKNRTLLLTTVAALALFGTGLTINAASSAPAKPAAGAAAMPAPSVTVKTVGSENVRIWSAFSGRMHAVDYAEIRPEVSGRIMEIRFKDGQTVKAGDILVVIDPRTYQAAVAKAEANLVSANTNAAFAKTELDRANNMIKSQAIAQRLLDERANSMRVADAAVLVAKAEVNQARVDLDHAYVKAPIGGRISRAEITQGNLVQAGPGAPVLTSIVSNDGIYADFEVDEATYMKSIRASADTVEKIQQIPVELTVQGDDEHPYKGTIFSFDNKIDSSSGTIRARAKFANEDGALVPGMFVSVKLASAGDNTVLLVPERAIGNDQSKRFVFVVDNATSKVIYREVGLGQEVAGQRIVLSGLQAGDRVIVDGLQHVKPDMVVQAKEASLAVPGSDNHAVAAN